MIVLLVMFSSLGFWQLSRADEKRALIAAFEDRLQSPALTAAALQADDATDLRFRRVRLAGRYLPERQFLLDNRVHARRAGFEVLTPFRLDDGRVLLINRGWVPLGATRRDLPDVSMQAQPEQVEGWIYVPFGEAYSLGALDDPDSGWPRIVQDLDFDLMSERVGTSLLPMTLRLSADAAEGFVRDWRVVPMTPAKHIAYAVQWFSLGIAVLVLYLVLNMKRRSEHD